MRHMLALMMVMWRPTRHAFVNSLQIKTFACHRHLSNMLVPIIRGLVLMVHGAVALTMLPYQFPCVTNAHGHQLCQTLTLVMILIIKLLEPSFNGVSLSTHQRNVPSRPHALSNSLRPKLQRWIQRLSRITRSLLGKLTLAPRLTPSTSIFRTCPESPILQIPDRGRSLSSMILFGSSAQTSSLPSVPSDMGNNNYDVSF